MPFYRLLRKAFGF
jgi:hypothetical protein